MSFEISCQEFEDGDVIPTKFTVDGENVNPEITFHDIPYEAETLAIIVDSTDDEGEIFTHWLMWNIPAHTNKIYQEEAPDGAVEAYNDKMQFGYTGPNPAPGMEVEYHFKVFALDTELELDEDITQEKLEKEIAGHIIDEASLVGTYSR